MKLSEVSKMPGKSWALNAGPPICPGALAADGKLTDVCEICYARRGRYRMPVVKEFRRKNLKHFLNTGREAWVEHMARLIRREDWFRWFDGGDIVNEEMARRIYEVCKATPTVRHWIPTKSYKFKLRRKWLIKMHKLPNVCVRSSSDTIDGNWVNQTNHFGPVGCKTMVMREGVLIPTNARICPAYKQDGECGECRMCWDKDDAVVYPEH